MLNNLFDSILVDTVTQSAFITSSVASIILGIVIAKCFTFKNRSSSNFAITLALLPLMVQVVIMLVNGNLGTGVAVMGAFSLVRFRSIPGNAKEIGSVFLAMSVGLATGTGYVGIAILVTLMCCILNIIYSIIGFGAPKSSEKELKITIPESLDYTEIFDDIFKEYTSKCELTKVRTTNMGSLYQIFYIIELRKSVNERKFIDEIRCRNGNLDIVCGKVQFGKDEL